MFVSSMSSEELYAEAMKDFFNIADQKSIYLWIVVESATGKNTLSEDLLKEW